MSTSALRAVQAHGEVPTDSSSAGADQFFAVAHHGRAEGRFLAFSPGGRRLAIAGERESTAQVWKLASLKGSLASRRARFRSCAEGALTFAAPPP